MYYIKNLILTLKKYYYALRDLGKKASDEEDSIVKCNFYEYKCKELSVQLDQAHEEVEFLRNFIKNNYLLFRKSSKY